MKKVNFAKGFEKFIKYTGFSIYLCRCYNPSTKGKVEKTVDYFKHQFLDGKIYCGLDRLNQLFIDWLDFDRNGKINDLTKKSPRIRNIISLAIKTKDNPTIEEMLLTEYKNWYIL